MFAFPFFGKKSAQPSVAAASESGSLVLISQEDIYASGHRNQPILLLRKGQEIPAHDLPKLIQNGVRPDQVSFQYSDSVNAFQLPESLEMQWDAATSPSTLPAGRTIIPSEIPTGPSPLVSMPMPVRSGANRRSQTVLILETDPKHMKRLIDCLFVCGFDLNRIHPLRISGHLAWAMRRHQPEFLVVDYRQALGEDFREILQSENTLEQLIVTIDASMSLQEATEALSPLYGESGIPVRILQKPISRFAVKHLLNPESAMDKRPMRII